MNTILGISKHIQISYLIQRSRLLDHFFLSSLTFILLILGVFSVVTHENTNNSINASTFDNYWQNKPIFCYYTHTPSIWMLLSKDVGFSQTQLQILQDILFLQKKQLNNLAQESSLIIQSPELTLTEKHHMIAEMGYNQRLSDIISTTNHHLEIVLGTTNYKGLVDWGYSHWIIENQNHGRLSTNQLPREYKIYAGQYDSRGAYYAALPDQCVKTANLSDLSCDQYGYDTSKKYDVYISYQGNSAAARVGDSGPWNTDDNYWATAIDPTPRRLFTDLPVGMPEAQAAFFDNYNDGKDQYGRLVTFPTGIELSRPVAKDLGLGLDAYDWVKVAYLWTKDWDDPIIESTSESSELDEQKVQVATEQPNGSIIHLVQVGESPLAIASAYGISVEELLNINEMTQQSVLQPGENLIIKVANRTAIPSWKLTATYQPAPTKTRKPTRTLQPSETISSIIATENTDNKPIPEDHQSGDNSFDNSIITTIENINPWYVIIASIVLIGFGFIIVGSFLNRNQ